MKSFAEYRAIAAADFDGTLHDRAAGITFSDLEVLQRLAEAGIARGIATGRSPYSFYSAVDGEFPADYLIFSSGSGVLEIGSGRVLRHLVFESEKVHRLVEMLIARDADFMVHFPMPLNHHFYYRASSRPGTDFHTRLELYRRFASPLPPAGPGAAGRDGVRRGASQIVAVFPPESGEADEVEEEASAEAGVVRATSPLDGCSQWVELYPPGTDKGSALAWLAERMEVGPGLCLGVGNDYNDLHMLRWCGTSFVVANAPEDLRYRYRMVASCGESGFSEAVSLWRHEVNL